MIRFKQFFIFSLIFIVFCTNKTKKPITEKENTKETNNKYSYIAIFCNKLLLLDTILDIKDSINLNDSLKSYQYTDNLYLFGKSTYTLLFNNLYFSEIENRDENIKNFNSSIMYKNYLIYLLDNSVVLKKDFNFHTLLKTNIELKNIWLNPYHKYIYAYDSLNYLYSVNYDDKILKKKIYVGKIKKIEFYKFGTRLYILTNNAFLILDYETLNIIYEHKKKFDDFAENTFLNTLYLKDNDNTSILCINSVRYNEENKIAIGKKITDLKCNSDSLLAIIYDSPSHIKIFSNKTIYDEKTNYSIDSIINFNSNILLFSAKDSVFFFNIKSKEIHFVCPMKNLLSIIPFKPDSIFIDSIYFTESRKKKEFALINNYEKKKIEHFYSIQIFSYENANSAINTVKNEKKKHPSIDFFAKRGKLNNKNIFRVYAGKFENKSDAKAFKNKLLNSGYKKDIFISKISSENIIE